MKMNQVLNHDEICEISLFLRQCQNQAGIITQGTKTTPVETGEMRTERTGDTERTGEHLMEMTDHEATERNNGLLTRPPGIIVRESKEGF